VGTSNPRRIRDLEFPLVENGGLQIIGGVPAVPGTTDCLKYAVFYDVGIFNEHENIAQNGGFVKASTLCCWLSSPSFV
ncbi:hypothetical protein L0Y59_02030, partial [Candidatus Uhrbacteria bacterium]|nr:hypothetical protein [Candidatus Uhrbacteria bacterium]